MDSINRKKTTGKPQTRNEERRNVATIPQNCTDGRKTRNTELLSWRSGGLKLTSRTSTTSPLLTSRIWRLTRKISFWKHDLHEKWRPKSPSRTIVEKRRLQKNNKCAVCFQREQGEGVPHIPIQMRTRQHNTLDPTIQQNLEWLSQNCHGHRSQHGGILNTGKILNCGESGKQKNGKTKRWWEKW